MSRVTFREWSIMVGMGEPGFVLLRARRAMRQATERMLRAVALDAILHGTGVSRISMGEDCTPILQRIDPNDFYVHPSDTGERQSDE